MFRLAALVALMAAPVAAQTFTSGYVGCATQDALSELITAATNKDARQINALMGKSCASLDGYDFSVVERKFTRSQVRVYVGQESVLLWTVNEAVADATD